MTWTAAGFQVVQRDLPGQEYTVTGTISDAGDVSVLYGGVRSRGEDCALNVLTVPVAGAETQQQLAVDNACADVDLAQHLGHDGAARRARLPRVAGDRHAARHRLAVGRHRHRPRGRAGTGSPPRPRHRRDPVRQLARAAVAGGGITRQAALHRAGLRPGRPALGRAAPDREAHPRVHLGRQLHRRAARRLRPPPQVRAARSVSWSAPTPGCGTTSVSTESPLGVSPDGQYVAASNQTRTLIFSRERGLRPAAAADPCRAAT